MTAPVAPITGTRLDYLKRIIAGEIPGVPIGDKLGFRLVEADPGRVVLLGTPEKGSYNLLGSVHGGWAAAILDTALTLSTLSNLDETQGFTTSTSASTTAADHRGDRRSPRRGERAAR